MTKDNILRLHKYFLYLESGEFTERDFDFEIEGKRESDEAGNTRMGKMKQPRIDLIKTDAKRHREAIEAKFPYLVSKPTKAPITDEITEEKSVKKKTSKKKGDK